MLYFSMQNQFTELRREEGLQTKKRERAFSIFRNRTIMQY